MLFTVFFFFSLPSPPVLLPDLFSLEKVEIVNENVLKIVIKYIGNASGEYVRVHSGFLISVGKDNQSAENYTRPVVYAPGDLLTFYVYMPDAHFAPGDNISVGLGSALKYFVSDVEEIENRESWRRSLTVTL